MTYNNIGHRISVPSSERYYQLSPWTNNHQDQLLLIGQQNQIKPNNRQPIRVRNRFLIQKQKQTIQPKQQKNSIKIKDYILPPLMTRRSNVKLKQIKKDQLDSHNNNLYFQRQKSRQKFRKISIIQCKQKQKQKQRVGSSQKLLGKDQSYKKLNDYLHKRQLDRQQKTIQFRLSGRRYSFMSSLDAHSYRSQNRYRLSSLQNNYGEDYYSRGTIPINKIIKQGTKSQTLKKVLNQLKGKTIQT